MSIEVNNLSFKYKNKEKYILNNFSFSLNNGEILTILGPNGSGKSTLLKCIFGLFKYDGSIKFNNINLENLNKKDRNKNICYMPQDNNVICNLTVYEVILLGKICEFNLIPNKEILNEVNEIIEEFKISHLSKKKYSDLSGGEKRIVNIVQILVKKGNLLILDEPTANLDILNELKILELIYSYTKKRNIITILVLHAINLASRFSDKILMIKNNKIYKFGNPKEVISKKTIYDVYGVNAVIFKSKEGNKFIQIESSNDLNKNII